MAYLTMHFAPTSRGSGDGSTYDNAAELFPSGNWSSLLTSNNYANSGIVALCQNTSSYSLSQQGTTVVFSGGAPDTIGYGLSIIAADSSGNIIDPIDYGWSCAESDLDTTNYCTINYGLTTGALSSSTNISFKCCKITSTNSNTTALFTSFIGLINWCSLEITTGVSTALGISFSTTSTGITNSQIKILGATGWNRIITASSTGLISNIRVKGSSSGAAGNRYGVAHSTSSNTIFTNGSIFICDCPGIGLTNYSTNISAGLSASKLTIIDCGVGIKCLVSTGGGVSKLALTDSMITGCTYGLSHPYGRYILENVVLRNTNNYETANGNYGGEPSVFITTEIDSDLYADYLNKDYRIKTTSSHWGKNRGAQDDEVSDGTGEIGIGIGIGRQLARTME